MSAEIAGAMKKLGLTIGFLLLASITTKALTMPQLVAQTKPSVVLIGCRDRGETWQKDGTGFLYEPHTGNLTVVTNAHIIKQVGGAPCAAHPYVELRFVGWRDAIM